MGSTYQVAFPDENTSARKKARGGQMFYIGRRKLKLEENVTTVSSAWGPSA